MRFSDARIHHDSEPLCLGAGLRLIARDALLQPECSCPDLRGFIGNRRRIFGAAEDVDDIDADGNVAERAVGSFAQDLGFTRIHRYDAVTRLLQLAPEPVSLSQTVGEDGRELGAAITDVTATSPADAALGAELSAEVIRLLGLLDSPDREVMSLRFGFTDDEPWSLEAIARALGLSRQTVRQSQARALRTLRRAALASPGARELLAI